jgi:hypothetical protein
MHGERVKILLFILSVQKHMSVCNLQWAHYYLFFLISTETVLSQISYHRYVKSYGKSLSNWYHNNVIFAIISIEILVFKVLHHVLNLNFMRTG